MDEQLLRTLYHRLMHGPEATIRRRSIYSDGLITLMYLYAVLSHRSPRWASVLRHWPLWLQAQLTVLTLPSYSQFMRRLKRPALWQTIERLLREYRLKLPEGNEKVLDGKPTASRWWWAASPRTKTPDAARCPMAGREATSCTC